MSMTDDFATDSVLLVGKGEGGKGSPLDVGYGRVMPELMGSNPEGDIGKAERGSAVAGVFSWPKQEEITQNRHISDGCSLFGTLNARRLMNSMKDRQWDRFYSSRWVVGLAVRAELAPEPEIDAPEAVQAWVTGPQLANVWPIARTVSSTVRARTP
ncbi:MAG: hypothetical protein ACREBR_01080 [bacterium]